MDKQPKSKIQNIAVIIEPRQHKALYHVVNNVLSVLPLDWNIRIYHGTKNLYRSRKGI